MTNGPKDAINSLKNVIWFSTKKNFLIVEGGNDSKVLKPFFKEDVLILNPSMVSNNKGVVIEVIEDKKKKITSGGKNVIGIIDADFNRIIGNLRNDLQNLFYTDTHDIDSMIFSTNALEKVISLLYYQPQNVNIENVREKCLEIASEFGFYLLSFYDNNLHHLKKKLRYIELFFDRNLKFLHENLFDELIQERDLEKIKRRQIQRKKQNLDQYQIANGHDLVRVFIMLTLWGSMNLTKKGMIDSYRDELIDIFVKREKFIKEFENILRISYEFDYFRNSDIYRQISIYEQTIGINFLKRRLN